ncbi:Sulfite exporter TauE/SafE (plasmid) [Piscirickettsia salmonis]|nr:Sulfite exporter TauE/SafE [Piscirickettsia salmonis]
MECAASRHVTLCDADSRGFIVVAFCSAILHHWMCKIPTEVATLTLLASSVGMVGLPYGSVGYLYLPAFTGLLIGSLLGSPLGVWLVKRASEQISVWVFRIILLAVVIQMVR